MIINKDTVPKVEKVHYVIFSSVALYVIYHRAGINVKLLRFWVLKVTCVFINCAIAHYDTTCNLQIIAFAIIRLLPVLR